MSKESVITRDYKFSDGLLKQKADGIVANIERDVAQFTARGITSVRVNAFKGSIVAFDSVSYDDIMLGKIALATEGKDAIAEQLRVAIRTIRTITENAFGTKSSRYSIYRFERLNNTPDEILYRFARSVVEIATNELVVFPELATEGLTQDMIDTVKDLTDAFDIAIDNILRAQRNRDESAHDRIVLGNTVYREMAKLCNVGKDIFASTNEAKYNDYVIYNTPTGEAPEAGTTGSIRGTATNATTLVPINEVEIYFDDIEEEPIFTDEDGEFMRDIVPVTCKSFIATHPEFQDYNGTFTILPDQEIVFDFSMEPKV